MQVFISFPIKQYKPSSNSFCMVSVLMVTTGDLNDWGKKNSLWLLPAKRPTWIIIIVLMSSASADNQQQQVIQSASAKKIWSTNTMRQQHQLTSISWSMSSKTENVHTYYTWLYCCRQPAELISNRSALRSSVLLKAQFVYWHTFVPSPVPTTFTVVQLSLKKMWELVLFYITGPDDQTTQDISRCHTELKETNCSQLSIILLAKPIFKGFLIRIFQSCNFNKLLNAGSPT